MGKLKVRKTKKMGRGLYATSHIHYGEIVEVSPCIILSRKYSEDQIQDSELKFYVFDGGKAGSVLALGNGSLFNHADKPNVTYRYDAKRNCMVFKALEMINSGEQLFINYGYDPNLYVEWYKEKDRVIEENKKWYKESKEKMDELMTETPETVAEVKRLLKPKLSWYGRLKVRLADWFENEMKAGRSEIM